MKKLLTLSLLIFITTGCRNFQQEVKTGKLSSLNGQFSVNYNLIYSTGYGHGGDIPQRFEDELRKAFQRYSWGYNSIINRDVHFEITFKEAIVRLVNIKMNVWGTNGKLYASLEREYGVFDFNEAVQKAEEFFQFHGYLLTGGTRLDREGSAYVDFTITEDFIDKIFINARGRDGYNGTCRCYIDKYTEGRVCRGTPGGDGEDGGDVVINYPRHLSDRLQLLEIHNEGGRGGFGGVCADGGDHGYDGFRGRDGQIFYREI